MMSEAGNNPVDTAKPWEKDWALKSKQAVTETVEKAVEAVKMPWERLWKEKPRATPQQGVTEAPTPAIDVSTEAGMKKAAQFTPQELSRQAAQERSPANIKELKAEIAAAKDPKTKKILEDHLKNLGG